MLVCMQELYVNVPCNCRQVLLLVKSSSMAAG
jgi:hypothetical protein